MTDFNPDELSTNNSDGAIESLKSIAETGDVEAEWPELQQALIDRLNAMVEAYQEKDAEGGGYRVEEPNLHKFDRNITKDEIIELIQSFSEPPFTIQRVCELLYSPFKYYDRITTFFRGLEKNLRVISSNNWPKSIDNSINYTNCNSSGSDTSINNSNNNIHIDDSNNNNSNSSSSNNNNNGTNNNANDNASSSNDADQDETVTKDGDDDKDRTERTDANDNKIS